MWITLTIGLRNLRRRPGRTLLTVGMIATTTLLVVFSVGLRDGAYEQMIGLATGTWSGHFQIAADGFRESPSLFETIDEPAPIVAALEADPAVLGVTARVSTAGLLSVEERSAGAMISAVDPAAEAALFTVPSAVKQGSFLGPAADPEALPIVLGTGLGQRLKAGLGDEVTFLGQAADGSIAAELFTVVGLLESGDAALDATVAFIRLGDAQALFELGRRIHSLHGRLVDIDGVRSFAAGLALPPGLEVAPWTVVMPGLDETIRADRVGGDLFIGIILFVVVLGILNSMLMAVFERTRELGIMLAIGTAPRRLVAVIAAESAWMSAVGVALGVAGGLALIALLADSGIPLGDEPLDFGGVMLDRMVPVANLQSAVIFPLVIFVSGTLAGLWPARRAARLDPVRAIREA